MKLYLSPITLREARSFVDYVHRPPKAPQGGLFALSACIDGLIVGVAIVGRPVSRMLDDGYTAEITRLATLGNRNACSFLYGACRRAAFALGYRKVITYILDSEPGTSLNAAGFRCVGQKGGGSWSRQDRPRVDLHPTQMKLRWETEVAA